MPDMQGFPTQTVFHKTKKWLRIQAAKNSGFNLINIGFLKQTAFVKFTSLVPTIVNFHYFVNMRTSAIFNLSSMNFKEYEFGFGWLEHWKATGIIGILVLVLALVAGEGCGKSSKNVPPSAAAPSPSDSNAAALAATPPANWTHAPTPSSSTNAPGPTQLQLLNRALLVWRMNNHRRPKTFEEFASTAGFQIPAPPAGKKYALSSSGFIVLVNSN